MLPPTFSMFTNLPHVQSPNNHTCSRMLSVQQMKLRGLHRFTNISAAEAVRGGRRLRQTTAAKWVEVAVFQNSADFPLQPTFGAMTHDDWDVSALKVTAKLRHRGLGSLEDLQLRARSGFRARRYRKLCSAVEVFPTYLDEISNSSLYIGIELFDMFWNPKIARSQASVGSPCIESRESEHEKKLIADGIIAVVRCVSKIRPKLVRNMF